MNTKHRTYSVVQDVNASKWDMFWDRFLWNKPRFATIRSCTNPR